MTRDKAREMAMQIVFGQEESGADAKAYLEDFFDDEHFATLTGEADFFDEKPEGAALDYIRDVVLGVEKYRDWIDEAISNSSRSWQVHRISGTALAVMRIAVYEMYYRDDVPHASAINSAVEIAKKYDDSKTVSFLNGVLGSITKENLHH